MDKLYYRTFHRFETLLDRVMYGNAKRIDRWMGPVYAFVCDVLVKLGADYESGRPADEQPEDLIRRRYG